MPPNDNTARVGQVQNYTDLRVYQLAFESAMEIFRLSRKWPPEKKYSLTDQIRRSSRSVCSNLGEAWRKRRYPNHFVSKLSDADTEAAETEVWLDFALECGYLNQETQSALREKYNHICAMLTKMTDNPEPWCRRARSKEKK
jgi:four helix bundle protein